MFVNIGSSYYDQQQFDMMVKRSGNFIFTTTTMHSEKAIIATVFYILVLFTLSCVVEFIFLAISLNIDVFEVPKEIEGGAELVKYLMSSAKNVEVSKIGKAILYANGASYSLLNLFLLPHSTCKCNFAG